MLDDLIEALAQPTWQKVVEERFDGRTIAAALRRELIMGPIHSVRLGMYVYVRTPKGDAHAALGRSS